MGDFDLFRVCSNMLNDMKDPHVGIIAPFGYSEFLKYKDLDYEEFAYGSMEPFNISVACTYLTDKYTVAGDGSFLYGTFKVNPDVGYLFINDFYEYKLGFDIIPDWVKEIDGIIKKLMDTDMLVLDIRGSWGGLGSNMDYIASRFAATQEDYIQFCTKNGPGHNDFSTPITWSINLPVPGMSNP
jgi:hypothetical protein